mmetsp:Transcript_63730/g.197322  ORF Transcript_63730/g.197322 Transcript_63730/m.197322 type:complete len:329 (+) Transcript_63730:57-1043(+)
MRCSGGAALLLLLAADVGEALRGVHQRDWTDTEAEAVAKRPAARVACASEEAAARAKVDVFRAKYGPRIREAFAAVDGPVYMTVSGGGQHIRTLANYLIHVQQVGIAEGRSTTAVSAMLEQTSLDACRAMKSNLGAMTLNCVDVTGWISTKREAGVLPFQFWWSKPVIFELAVESSQHGVLLMDTDIVVYQDLLGYADAAFQEDQSLLLACSADMYGFWYNSGTIYATQRSLPLLRLWVEENNCYWGKGYGDQSALNSLISRNLTQLGADSSSVLMMSPHMIGQACHKGSHATHYNCLEKAAKGLQGVMEEGEDWVDVEAVIANQTQA